MRVCFSFPYRSRVALVESVEMPLYPKQRVKFCVLGAVIMSSVLFMFALLCFHVNAAAGFVMLSIQRSYRGDIMPSIVCFYVYFVQPVCFVRKIVTFLGSGQRKNAVSYCFFVVSCQTVYFFFLQ